MPDEWYSQRSCKILDEDDDETIARKEFNSTIAASRKPYFMTYVYPKLKEENDTYVKSSERGVIRRYGCDGVNSVDAMSKRKSSREQSQFYHKLQPVGCNPCVVNRIAWFFEKNFDGVMKRMNAELCGDGFDYTILKSNVPYSKANYNQIYALYREYKRKIEKYAIRRRTERIDSFENYIEHNMMADWFRARCEMICTNEKELCDIIIDICYTSENSKQFAWDICGDTIVSNLLEKNGHRIRYPVLANDGVEFTYSGRKMKMKEMTVSSDDLTE